MRGFRINPDKKLVSVIMEGLERKDGHCPCRINVDDSTLCPCDEFVNDRICRCKLYVPLEDVCVDVEADDNSTSDSDNNVGGSKNK